MAGLDDIINKIKGLIFVQPKAMKGVPGKPGAAGSQTAAPKPGTAPKMAGTPGGAQGDGKKFDFNMYLKAVKLFGQDFFGKKIPYFFRNLGPVLKGFPVWWSGLAQDEQISYGCLCLGNVMMVTGLVLLIVL